MGEWRRGKKEEGGEESKEVGENQDMMGKGEEREREEKDESILSHLLWKENQESWVSLFQGVEEG